MDECKNSIVDPKYLESNDLSFGPLYQPKLNSCLIWNYFTARCISYQIWRKEPCINRDWNRLSYVKINIFTFFHIFFVPIGSSIYFCVFLHNLIWIVTWYDSAYFECDICCLFNWIDKTSGTRSSAAKFSVVGWTEIAQKWNCWKLQEKRRHPKARKRSLLGQ